MNGPESDIRAELAQLAEELRAHAEWQLETGVTGAVASPRARPGRAMPSRTPATSKLSDGPVLNTSGASAAQTPSAAQSELGAPVASPASPHPSGDKPRLLELAQEVRTCQKCELHRTRTQTVFARGNPSAELCFVGEGPGADEDAQGLPFVGKAGQLLDRMIAAMGFSPVEVYVCNIVKCRPPENRKPEPAEISACKPYLREQLELVGPKVIVALGATAVEGLIGMGGGITRMRGQWKLYRNIPLMPTFHPAYLLRNPAAKREVWADLQAVLKQLGRSPPPAGRSA